MVSGSENGEQLVGLGSDAVYMSPGLQFLRSMVSDHHRHNQLKSNQRPQGEPLKPNLVSNLVKDGEKELRNKRSPALKTKHHLELTSPSIPNQYIVVVVSVCLYHLII